MNNDFVVGKMIPLFKVYMSPKVHRPVNKTLRSGYIGQGPKVEKFEKVLQDRFLNPNILTLAAGTHGLHLAAVLAGVGPGKTVITTPLTCFATNSPFLQQGASLVWADVTKDLNIDPRSVESRITPQTKAIVVMHWGGYPCDMAELYEISRWHGVPIIEDACHAFGSTYQGFPVGDCTYSDYAIISFQAIKALTTVDGGMLSTRSPEDYKRGKLLRWYGMNRETDRLDFRCGGDAVVESGFKYHMNDVCATIGLENIKDVDANIQKAQDNTIFYRMMLAGVDGVELIPRKRDRTSSEWLFTVLVENQEDFMKMMLDKKVQVSRVHERNDLYSCVKDYKMKDLDMLEYVVPRMVCIPNGWWVGKEEREYIVDCIKGGW